MTNRSEYKPAAMAFIAGVLLFAVAALISHRREPWDDSVYWLIPYPLSLLVCGWLGYRWPERPWRWVMVLFEAQFVAMCIRNGELGNLWPLGMAMFALIGLPGVLTAKVGARYSASR